MTITARDDASSLNVAPARRKEVCHRGLIEMNASFIEKVALAALAATAVVLVQFYYPSGRLILHQSGDALNNSHALGRPDALDYDDPPPACTRMHIMHIGKTGGTAMKVPFNFMGEHATVIETKNHRNHGFVLGSGGGGESACYAFTVRDPVSRWVSGFLSNARVGCPDHFHRSRLVYDKAVPFLAFPTPNDLAEALSDPVRGPQALAAASMIPHCARGFAYYLPNIEEFVKRKRLPVVLSTSSLRNDTERLWRYVGGDKAGSLPDSNRNHMHRMPDAWAQFLKLSQRARCNLEQLLRRDYEIMDFLHENGAISERFDLQCAIENPLPIATSRARPSSLRAPDTKERFEHTARLILRSNNDEAMCDQIVSRYANRALYHL